MHDGFVRARILASNLLRVFEDLSILDFSTLLSLPCGDNRVELAVACQALLNLNLMKGDASLDELLGGYERVYSIAEVCPAATKPIDSAKKGGRGGGCSPLAECFIAVPFGHRC